MLKTEEGEAEYRPGCTDPDIYHIYTQKLNMGLVSPSMTFLVSLPVERSLVRSWATISASLLRCPLMPCVSCHAMTALCSGGEVSV